MTIAPMRILLFMAELLSRPREIIMKKKASTKSSKNATMTGHGKISQDTQARQAFVSAHKKARAARPLALSRKDACLPRSLTLHHLPAALGIRGGRHTQTRRRAFPPPKTDAAGAPKNPCAKIARR